MARYTEVLDTAITKFGDKYDKVTLDEMVVYGDDFVDWLIREGYKTRMRWRKSNAAAAGRRSTQTDKAKEYDRLMKDPKVVAALKAITGK